MPTHILRKLLLPLLGSLLVGVTGWMIYISIQPATQFLGERAYRDVINQVSFGARIPGSVAHAQVIDYIKSELEKASWEVQFQTTDWQGFSVQNIIAFRSMVAPRLIIGAHYDSRLMADQENGSGHSQPVPGANDGASGVAVLLELARSLPSDVVPIWLVFFDAEDNGGLDNRQWIMGSRAFVASLVEQPQAAVIVDMVGDSDLNLYFERNSDSKISAEIWSIAASLGYGNYFVATPKYTVLDDHTPFLEAGIPAVDIIDFDYPFWHTTADTLDKVSAQSLQAVGETLWGWIESH